MKLMKKGVEMRFLVLIILGLIALLVVALIFFFGMDWFVGSLRGIITDINATRPDFSRLKLK